MAASEKYIPEEKIIDFCNHGVYRFTVPSDCNGNTVVLLDYNKIRSFENIDGYRDIILQISVANNCLISLKGVSNFRKLCVLNLSNNFIDKIEDLFELKHLTWLNLSGNQIKIIENLGNNLSLEHLDLSYNCIQILGDLSHLLRLKSLLLHGNLITSFKTEIGYFPENLLTLSLAENEITDIKEISQLSSLTHLEQLSVMGNPCARRSTDKIKYKNFILCNCQNLKVLDGAIIQPNNPVNLLEKHNPCISTLNINYTKPNIRSISPETMIKKAKTKTNNILFPCSSSFQKAESIFKKNSLVVSYSTDSPEKISYQSEQELILQEDAKEETFSTIPNFLCSPLQLRVNSSTELTTPNYLDIEFEREAKEETMSPDTWKRLESKYEAYDNRPVRPLSKNFYKAISDSSYLSCSPPQPSKTEPVISSKKKTHQEFVSQAFNCDESHGQEVGDKINPNKKTDAFNGKPSLMKSARKQHKTALNSVTKNVVKPHETQIKKKSSEFGIKHKCELNDQLKEKLSANENSLNESKHFLLCSPPPPPPPFSTDHSLNTKNISTRNKEVKTFSNQSSTLTSSGKKSISFSNTMPTITTTTTDSAFGSQGDFYNQLSMHRAATQIQALWRGFQCRNLNPQTKHAYMELRCLRAQQHIAKLSTDLEQQKDICEQKNNLLKQFLELVQIMWKELQSNKDSKKDDLSCNLFSNSPSCKNCDSQQTLTTFNTKLENLQQTCHTLNTQVKHLHETLHTFMMGNFSCHPGNNTDHPELHLKNNDPNSTTNTTDTGYWSYILEDEENHERKNFKESTPNPPNSDSCRYVSVPDCLTLLPLSENSIMLSWSPSTLKRIDENISHTLLGYKIYVNGHPMAFVPANKTQLIISNLDIYLTYIISVSTISTLQESKESQKLIANYCMKNVKERNVILHSDADKSKSIPEVNETWDSMNPDDSKIVSKKHQIIKSDSSDSSPNDSKNKFPFEHKKPTIAEVVEKRFQEFSKNILLEECDVSRQKQYKHLKKKSKSLENIAGCFVNRSNQIDCFLSAKQQKQTLFICSDDEEEEEGEEEGEDCMAEFDKTNEKKRLISLLEKLCSFSISQDKAENLSKFQKPRNLNWTDGKFSPDI